MKPPQVAWDEPKDVENESRHGVSFEDASTVFPDEHALLLVDPDHSLEEDRFILMGFRASRRLLVICRCDRRGERMIRILSARKAAKSERAVYSERWRR